MVEHWADQMRKRGWSDALITAVKEVSATVDRSAVRGIVSPPYRDRVLFTKIITIQPGHMPRLAPTQHVDPELYEDDE